MHDTVNTRGLARQLSETAVWLEFRAVHADAGEGACRLLLVGHLRCVPDRTRIFSNDSDVFFADISKFRGPINQQLTTL